MDWRRPLCECHLQGPRDRFPFRSRLSSSKSEDGSRYDKILLVPCFWQGTMYQSYCFLTSLAASLSSLRLPCDGRHSTVGTRRTFLSVYQHWKMRDSWLCCLPIWYSSKKEELDMYYWSYRPFSKRLRLRWCTRFWYSWLYVHQKVGRATTRRYNSSTVWADKSSKFLFDDHNEKNDTTRGSGFSQTKILCSITFFSYVIMPHFDTYIVVVDSRVIVRDITISTYSIFPSIWDPTGVSLNYD